MGETIRMKMSDGAEIAVYHAEAEGARRGGRRWSGQRDGQPQGGGGTSKQARVRGGNKPSLGPPRPCRPT